MVSPLKRIGRGIVYIAIPASFFHHDLFSGISIITSFYLISLFGFISLITTAGRYIDQKMLWVFSFSTSLYAVLLLIEIFHGDIFIYPIDGDNFLKQYFVVLALPFFVSGLLYIEVDLKYIDKIALAAVILACLVSVYQFVIERQQRPIGFDNNPIIFALIVSTWNAMILARGFSEQRIKVLWVATAAVGLIPVVLSGSKLVWAATLVAYGMICASWFVTYKRWWAMACTTAALIPIGWSLYRVSFVHQRISEFLTELTAFWSTGDTSGVSFGLRYSALVSGWRAVLDRPLLGYGLDQVRVAAFEHKPPQLADFTILVHLHNEFVTQMVAFGLSGLVFIIVILLEFFVAGAGTRDRTFRIFAYALGIMFAIYMTAEVVFRWSEVSGLLAFTLGLVLFASMNPATPKALKTPNELPVAWRSFSIPVMLLVTLVGAAGFICSQRNAFWLVAQRALLSEPATNTVAAEQFEGSVRWALGPSSSILGTIQVPEIGLSIELSIQQVPPGSQARHMVINITAHSSSVLADYAIASVGELAPKMSPDELGVPLEGSLEGLGDGRFQFDVSLGDQADRIAKSYFFSLPLVFQSGHVADLTFEKGIMGRNVFDRVFR